MKILSLFDGISGCRQALKELNIDCQYYASEIDKYAIQIAKANHPDIIQLGDVKELDNWNLVLNDLGGITNGRKNHVDLLIGGFPCQSFSIAGNRKGLEDERGQLFFEMIRILDEVKPKYFLFENVASMSKDNQAFISEKLGVEPIMINSALLTAQNRKRLYWVGKLIDGEYKQIRIEQPEDQEIYLKDIVEENVDEKYYINEKALKTYTSNGKIKNLKELNKKSCCLTASTHKGFGNDGCTTIRMGQFGKGGQGDRVYSVGGKSICLSANGGGRGAKTGLYDIDKTVRKLTPTECCRLQGFPDDYVSMVSNTQGYKGLGNSFTVPVIKHLIQSIIK